MFCFVFQSRLFWKPQESSFLSVGYILGRSSPQLDPLRKSPTMEQAVQTASAHLPAPAPVGRRSPGPARPLPSTSQKAIENQEHRRGRTLAVYCSLIDWPVFCTHLIFIEYLLYMSDPRRFKLNLIECSLWLEVVGGGIDLGALQKVWLGAVPISNCARMFDDVSWVDFACLLL